MAGLQFDHIGVVVPDLETGRRFFEQALHITQWTEAIHDPGLGVSVQFGSAQFGSAQSGAAQSGSAQSGSAATAAGSSPGPAYELISPLGGQSPVSLALRSGKNLLHHLAYLTPNLTLSAAHLRDEGCYPAGEAQPAIAYGGRQVQFFMSPLRFLIELIEAPGHRHAFAPSSFPGAAS